MDTGKRSAPVVQTEAQGMLQPESSLDHSTTPKDRNKLRERAEALGIAIRICKGLAENLSEPAAEGAREAVIALRLEVSRLLALMSQRGAT